jgi:predicted phage tail protein
MNKKGAKGQSPTLPVNCVSKTGKRIKALGFFFFLMGAVLIMTSFFKITGYVSSEGVRSTFSVGGIVLEVIGIVLMLIRINTNVNGR